MCGEQQVFQIRLHHHANCSSCDPTDWNKKTVQDFPAGQEFRSLLSEAAHRKGMTIGQVMDAAGIDVTLVARWANGGSTPYRHFLERLADVAECPELVDSIPSNVAWVTNTCPTGHKPEPYPALYIRREIKRGGLDPNLIDWATGIGSFLCGGCKASSRMKAINLKPSRNTKGGPGIKEIRIERGKFLGASTTYEEKLVNIKKAQQANIGRPQSEEHRFKTSAKRISPTPKGLLWNMCLLCPTLVLTREYLVGRNRGEVHGRCLNAWISENRVRARRHYPERQIKVKSYLTSEYLAVSFELVVRVVLHKEPMGEKERTDKNGKLIKVTGVAGDLGISSRVAYLRINEFIDLLPNDGLGGKKLTRKAEIIRWADTRRVRQEVAPTKLEKELGPMEIAQAFLLAEILSATDLVPSVQLFNAAKNGGITKKTLRVALEKGRYKAVQTGRAWHWRRKRPREA